MGFLFFSYSFRLHVSAEENCKNEVDSSSLSLLSLSLSLKYFLSPNPKKEKIGLEAESIFQNLCSKLEPKRTEERESKTSFLKNHVVFLFARFCFLH